MQLLPNYELLEVLTKEEPCTFRARQMSSGRTVLLHRLSGGRSYPDQVGLIRTVVRYLRQAPKTSRNLVLDMVEHEGAMYLVTEVLPGFRTLNEWLALEMKGQEEASVGSPRDTVPSSAPSPDRATSQTPIRSTEAKPQPGSEEAGEFTRMFQGPGVASSPPHRGDVAQAGSEKVPASPESGEPTEMLQASAGDRSSSVPIEVKAKTSDKVAAPPEAGEFARIFQPSAVDRSSGVPVEVPEVPLDKAAASPEPGEFTRIFQASAVDKPRSRPTEVPDSMPGRAPSEFTAIFKSPADAERPGAPDIQPSDTKEVGDFTRIFGSPGVAEPSSERLAASQPAALPRSPAPPQPAQNESASSPPVSAGAKPQQPLGQPTPKIPPISAPKVPAPKVLPISPPKVPDKPAFPTQPAPPPIQHTPLSIPLTTAPKVPPPVSPMLPQPGLPTSEERASYLPWILILGGLVLLGVVLIIYVFVRV